jgi:hypothetical protein
MSDRAGAASSLVALLPVGRWRPFVAGIAGMADADTAADVLGDVFVLLAVVHLDGEHPFSPLFELSSHVTDDPRCKGGAWRWPPVMCC